MHYCSWCRSVWLCKFIMLWTPGLEKLSDSVVMWLCRVFIGIPYCFCQPQQVWWCISAGKPQWLLSPLNLAVLRPWVLLIQWSEVPSMYCVPLLNTAYAALECLCWWALLVDGGGAHAFSMLPFAFRFSCSSSSWWSGTRISAWRKLLGWVAGYSVILSNTHVKTNTLRGLSESLQLITGSWICYCMWKCQHHAPRAQGWSTCLGLQRGGNVCRLCHGCQDLCWQTWKNYCGNRCEIHWASQH